jgi:hypothetical protein
MLMTVTEYVHYCNTNGQPTGYHDNDGDELLMTGIVHTRDSDALVRSNFVSIFNHLKDLSNKNNLELGPDILRFGHWACGWVEYLVIPKNDILVKETEQILNKLDDYPVFDEDLYSEYLYEDEGYPEEDE